MGDEVLQDHLLQVAVALVQAGERLQRRHAVVLRLADPDEDPARERDAQLAGGFERPEPQARVLGRRALVRDQVVAQRLEHHPLRRGDLAQASEVGARERAEVRVGEDAALEGALAAPHHVGDEVLEPEPREPLAHAGVVAGVVAREYEQLLDPAPRRAREQLLDLVGLVQVRPVRRERAVLAMGDAGAR